MHPAKGTRVVRGPDWRWGNQDGGHGNVGTILDSTRHVISSFSSNQTEPKKTRSAKVIWDNGTKGIYRVGPDEGAHDLLVILLD